MDQIITQIGSTVGGFFANPAVQFALQAAAVYVVGLWLASAYWAFRDLQGRTDNPVAPYLAASLVILFTPVFFLLAVTFFLLGIGNSGGNEGMVEVGGWFGLATAAAAWYASFAAVVNSTFGRTVLPVRPLGP